MAVVLVSTPAAPDANSYEEVAEADAYFETRPPLDPAWDDAESKEGLLIHSTRTLDASMRGGKVLVQDGDDSYYIVRRSWTGAPTTTTQRLAWPRTGMFDQNGNPIDPMVIPQDLKDAVSELGSSGVADRTLDSDVTVQGIKSATAGSVSVSFKDGYIDPKVLPDAVVALLPPSWYIEEFVLGTDQLQFEVMP